jgi:hypothetical protein
LIPSTSLQEDTLANLSPSQVEKKVKKIQDTSGQKCLDLSKSVGRLLQLEKTLLGTLNKVSTPYSITWRVKVTPLGRLVFQRLASVPTTKEKESGLWLTPSATTISKRSKESMEKRKKYRESIGRKTVPPGNLAEQIQFGRPTTEMWPTPRASKAMSEKTSNIQARGTDRGKLEERVALWPTPTVAHVVRRNHDEPIEKYQQRVKDYEEGRAKGKPGKSLGVAVRIKNDNQDGGTLNPNWVEWLMGYQTGHTDLNR